MDNIILILILIPIAILGLLVFSLTRKMDFLIRKISSPDRRVDPPVDRRTKPRNTLDAFLLTQRHWSAKTFGLGLGRWKGIVAHVEKELREIEQDPLDLEEWIDVIILGFDGAWRTGATNHAIIAALFAKQAKNRTREWIVSKDEAVPARHVDPSRPKISDVLLKAYEDDQRLLRGTIRPESPPATPSSAAPDDEWADPGYGVPLSKFREAMGSAPDVTATEYKCSTPLLPPYPISIDISVYPNRVTGKWVVQVGEDTYRIAQFESEEAARQYARQTGEMLKMQMRDLEERLANSRKDTKLHLEPPDTTPSGSKVTNLRRLSPEDMQRVMTDPEAYAEWRGVCGLENDPPKLDSPKSDKPKEVT